MCIERLLEDPELAREKLKLRADEDLPMVLACILAQIARTGERDSDRIAAIDRFLDRYDGPLNKQIDKDIMRTGLKQIIVVNVPGMGPNFEPEMPEEVLEVERAEEQAAREREARMALPEGRDR